MPNYDIDHFGITATGGSIMWESEDGTTYDIPNDVQLSDKYLINNLSETAMKELKALRKAANNGAELLKKSMSMTEFKWPEVIK